jgi:hypothetical protein
MAVAAADSSFICVSVGAPGGGNDSGIFAETDLGRQLADGTHCLPKGEYYLPNSNTRYIHDYHQFFNIFAVYHTHLSVMKLFR